MSDPMTSPAAADSIIADADDPVFQQEQAHLSEVHAALRRMGVAPENAVMIGDSAAADIPAANAAGGFSILFTNGRPAPENHGANAVAASYEEAERLILG